MENLSSKHNSLKFLIGLVAGIVLYILTNSIAFLIPLMLVIVTYNIFLSKYFKNYKI